MKKHRAEELEEEFSKKYIRIENQDKKFTTREERSKKFLDLTGDEPVGFNINPNDLNKNFNINNNNNNIQHIGAPLRFHPSEEIEGWKEKWGDKPPLRSDGYYGEGYDDFDYKSRFSKDYQQELKERHEMMTSHPYYAFALILTNQIKDSIKFFQKDFFLPGSLDIRQELHIKQLIEEKKSTRLTPSQLIKQEEELFKMIEDTKSKMLELQGEEKIAHDAGNTYNDLKKEWISTKKNVLTIDLLEMTSKSLIHGNDMIDLKNKYENVIFPKGGKDKEDLIIAAKILEENEIFTKKIYDDFINGKEVTLKKLLELIKSYFINPNQYVQLEQ
jgi:hypothetical protein